MRHDMPVPPETTRHRMKGLPVFRPGSSRGSASSINDEGPSNGRITERERKMRHWVIALMALLIAGYAPAYAGGEEQPPQSEKEEVQDEAAAADEGGDTGEEAAEEGEAGEEAKKEGEAGEGK